MVPPQTESGITFSTFCKIFLPNHSRILEKMPTRVFMKALSLVLAIFLCSSPVFAEEPLLLRHSIVATEATADGARATYRLELQNTGAHNLHSIDLSLQDVGLSLTTQPEIVHFQALPSGQQKHRLLIIHSALTAEQLAASPLLFHASTIDSFGQLDTVLMRSVVMP